MWIEKQVLVCMCGLPVNLSVKTSVFFNVQSTVQIRQLVVFYILPLNLMLLSTKLMCSVKASTSWVLILTQVSSTYLFIFVWAQCFAFHFLHIKISHTVAHWRSHGTAVLLSVETVIVFEIGGGEAKVQRDTDLIRSEVGSPLLMKSACR